MGEYLTFANPPSPVRDKPQKHGTRELAVLKLEKMNKRIKAFFTIAAIAAGLLCIGGCKTKERVVTVTVPEVHEVHHWHTDSTATSDSVIHEKETVVMQADSAMMAQFGVQLRENERAWLIKTKELERQLQRMERMISERDTVRDSIPYPVPVPEYVPAELTWWQKTRMHAGEALLVLLGIALIYGVARLILKFK